MVKNFKKNRIYQHDKIQSKHEIYYYLYNKTKRYVSFKWFGTSLEFEDLKVRQSVAEEMIGDYYLITDIFK